MQRAVLWPATGAANDYGESAVGPRVEIPCRWEEGKGKQADPLAENQQIAATVFVDRDIKIGSLLRLGTLDEVPPTPNNLVRVVHFRKIPDDKGIYYRRSVSVTKHSQDIPAS